MSVPTTNAAGSRERRWVGQGQTCWSLTCPSAAMGSGGSQRQCSGARRLPCLEGCLSPPSVCPLFCGVAGRPGQGQCEQGHTGIQTLCVPYPLPPTSQWHSLATYGPPPAWCHLPCGWLFGSPLMAASSPYSQRVGQGFSLSPPRALWACARLAAGPAAMSRL